MSSEKSTPSTDEIENRIERVGRYSRTVRTGFFVIVSAFLLAVGVVLPANLESASQAIESILLPLIFVGLGLILYGIGMHLHLMHLNPVRQLQPRSADDSQSSGEHSE